MLQNAYFLAKSEPIQPKTSNNLPKFCQPTLEEQLRSWKPIWPRNGTYVVAPDAKLADSRDLEAEYREATGWH